MPPTTTLNGFEWSGRIRITVSGDDGSLGLPFLFSPDDTAILTVMTSELDGMGTGDKKIKQFITCVPLSLGSEVTCSRTRSYNGKEHAWSAWEISSSTNGADVIWGASSSADSLVTAGTYNIKGERLNAKDGLPIANSNPGHTIHARLLVLDSSIAGTGDEQDKCITQVLTLSNRTGGDGDVYIRTGHAHSTNMLIGGAGWEPWSKLQQNIEVGQVTSLDTFTGNGMYSGVYTNGTSFFETFVMVVINNYAVAGATGQVRSISQFKYALNVDGTFSYKTRTGRGSTGISWGSWVDLGAATTTDIQDGAITAQKLSSDVREKVENPLRPLYIAAGAEYNDTGADKTKTAPWGETVTHKAGHYYLNGLGDISEEEMSNIYYMGKFWISENASGVLSGANGRTNISPLSVSEYHYKTFNFSQAVNNSKISVLVLAGIKDIKITAMRYLGQDSNSLSRIVGNIDLTASSAQAFNPKALEYVNIKNLKCILDIHWSSNISKESVLFMIQNANPTSAITITLHPDAYARLTNDADVVAALEAQPLISLVSA